MKKSYRDKAMKKDQAGGSSAIGTCRGCSEGLLMGGILNWYIISQTVFTDNAMLIACGHEVCIGTSFCFMVDVTIFRLSTECLADLAKSELRLDRDMYV